MCRGLDEMTAAACSGPGCDAGTRNGVLARIPTRGGCLAVLFPESVRGLRGGGIQSSTIEAG